MLNVSMGVSVDGFITDRDGDFNWSVPSDDLFRFHLESVSSFGAVVLGRKLYEAMQVWETDPAMRGNEDKAAFADVWTAMPKVVFSRTLHADAVDGNNARLATGSLADEIAATLASTDRDVEIGGAELARQAVELGLVDDFRIFRYPVIVGGGAPLLPPVTSTIQLDLVDTRVFDNGVVYERYHRVRDVG